MYENLPLGEVDSRVGQFARHDKEKPPPAPAAEQDAIVILGIGESETETESIERVSEIIHDTMELPSVTVVSAVRLGKQPAAEGRPRELLVMLGSQKQVMEVLTSARRLSELNNKRKANSESPIGIVPDLSPAELQHRSSVWAAFRAAKAAKKECRWKFGYRLYVDGSEVLPGNLCLNYHRQPDNMRQRQAQGWQPVLAEHQRL